MPVIPTLNAATDRPSDFPAAFNSAMAKRFWQDHVRVEFADSPYTVVANGTLILADAGAGAVVLNLPAAASNAGACVVVIAADVSNDITIEPNGAETINGAGDLMLTTGYERVTLFCDGTEWFSG